jgi:2-polyprenyl-3-methyl-5-hydroxy-6-metoxy-1,4-benzoquinol methylase
VSGALRCAVCFAETHPSLAPVRPNLRKLRDQRFHVWRCGRCESLHTLEAVDLARYYGAYEFDGGALNWATRKLLRPHLARLERAGLRRDQSILDFGCGSGKFVHFLQENGYEHACGYDAYAPEFKEPSLLQRHYDVLFAQDVLEHAENPWEMLHTFDRLLAPGGLIMIGTPNAEEIDPAKAERFVHSLHVPFHRHILSKRALLDVGAKLGWSLVRFYGDVYNTLYPFLNYRYVLFYMESWDNTPDSLAQIKPNLRLALHPLAHFYALFGALVPPKSECQILFRSPPAPARAGAPEDSSSHRKGNGPKTVLG